MTGLHRLLKESWVLLEDQQEALTSQLFARIFLDHPELRELFPVSLREHRGRFLAALLSAVGAQEPDRIDRQLRALGRDHRRFEARPEHYAVFGTALAQALRATGGPAWTEEYDRAWAQAYQAVAAAMLAGAAQEDGPPYLDAEVVAHSRRGPDVAVLTCRPAQPLGYTAGQYLPVQTGYRPRLWRRYSPANAPRPDGTIDLHVRARSGGEVSAALVRRVGTGDTLRLGAPAGTATLDRRSVRDVVCVAGGTGLAPVKALIEELTRYNRTRWVHLFLGARHWSDFYDLADLTALAARHPWLSVLPAVSDDPSFAGEKGAIADVMARYGPWNEHDFFVSGPPAMLRSTLRRLRELQVPSVRVKYDPPGDG